MLLSESPGTIAVPTAEIGRFTMFMVSMATTKQPNETNLSIMASASVVENLNQIIRQLRDEDEWIWILGDDHVWPQDTLMNMLQAMDDNDQIDILVPLVVKRNPPWHLVLFHEAGEYDDGLPRWKPYGWDEIPEHGTFEVDAAGNAGMLIRREVLNTMGDPWFQSSGGIILNEDVIFCRKARQLGYRVYATADVTMGHLGIFNVRPLHKDGRWGALTEFSSPEDQFKHIYMPVQNNHPEVIGARG